MSFLNNMINQFTHQGQSSGGQQQGQYGQQQSYGQQPYNDGRPHPPEPWIAEWDQYENRWIFINRQTGQRIHEFPQGGYGAPGCSQQQGQYGQQGGYGPTPPQQKSHNGRNVALGAAAGLAGGALLMHEGEKVEERWDEDKYRAEERFDNARYDVDRDEYRAENYAERKWDNGVNDVEDFPENAARWGGEKVQEVEDIPQDIDRKWDNLKQDVDDVPEDIAYGAGRVEGDFDRFDDRMDNAYDDGRDDQRYDDDRRDGW